MKRRQYVNTEDGVWFDVDRHDNRIMCCDCHLVHRDDVKVVGKRKRVFMRFRRDNYATAAARRRMTGLSELLKKNTELVKPKPPGLRR